MAGPGTERVQIWTDGACSGNPGPGGWGALLRYGEAEKELCGGEPTSTTNNRMELTAPIRALNALTRACAVDLHTDSTYVRNGIMSWVANWKRNGWRTKEGQPVKNADLWRELDAAVARHDEVVWHWVKGHAGHVENERADRLAARGQREALEAAGVPVPPLPEPRRAAVPRVAVTGDGARCRARTKAGRPCPINAGPSGFCHVHDPALLCGAPTSRGTRCGITTGGGRCRDHEHATTTVQTLDV